MNITTSAFPAPYRWLLRVYYEDTDSGGVVYYANYLRFMERARTEWLRSLGLGQAELAAAPGILFAVRAVNVEFLRPARLDDCLSVTVETLGIRSASLNLRQAVSRAQDDDKGELLARGEVKIACIGAGSFRPMAIPRSVRQVLQSANGS